DFSDRWHDLFAGFALGNLTPEEQAELDQLLESQPELRAELQAYEAALNQLPQGLELPALPPDLEAKILQGVHASTAASLGEESSGPAAIAAPAAPRYRWAAAAAIAAALVMLLGWDNYQLRQSLAVNRQKLAANQQKLAEVKEAFQQLEREQEAVQTTLASLQNPDAVYTLEGMGQLTDTLGSVITKARDNTATLVAHDLPTLPEEQVYRFWVADEDKELMYCGQFTVEDAAPIAWSLPDASCSTQSSQVAITIDPITASTNSGGELAMLSRSVEFSN
ncbi:MAG: anti-sigma factor, partial [Cyanobacteria bacterium P01_H01_bin.153]